MNFPEKHQNNLIKNTSNRTKDKITGNQTQHAKSGVQRGNNLLLITISGLIWTCFCLSSLMLYFHQVNNTEWKLGELIFIDSLTLVMWVAVTLIGGIISSYSLRYMTGFSNLNQFMIYAFLFTISVMLFFSANHVILLGFSWLSMGLAMQKLIGIVPDWKEAKNASKYALKNFLGGSTCVISGLGIMVYQTGSFSITTMLTNLSFISNEALVAIAFLLVIGAMIQSALFPFHRWLLSSMTTPTPASALMHAGFVNASGILLTRFAPVLFAADILWLLLMAGTVSALMGKFWKLIQVNIKRKLAASTLAQMGFMIIQCGLGFFNAAITHLILHGFFKAYQFLASGSVVDQELPAKTEKQKFNGKQIIGLLTAGFLGGFLFALLTGKGLNANSGLFLTFIVVLTVIQAARELILRLNLPAGLNFLVLNLILLPVISIYALVFNGITNLLAGTPLINEATPLNLFHLIITMLFIMAFWVTNNGFNTGFKRLYVYFLNLSQPFSKTIVAFKK